MHYIYLLLMNIKRKKIGLMLIVSSLATAGISFANLVEFSYNGRRQNLGQHSRVREYYGSSSMQEQFGQRPNSEIKSLAEKFYLAENEINQFLQSKQESDGTIIIVNDFEDLKENFSHAMREFKEKSQRCKELIELIRQLTVRMQRLNGKIHLDSSIRPTKAQLLMDDSDNIMQDLDKRVPLGIQKLPLDQSFMVKKSLDPSTARPMKFRVGLPVNR